MTRLTGYTERRLPALSWTLLFALSAGCDESAGERTRLVSENARLTAEVTALKTQIADLQHTAAERLARAKSLLASDSAKAEVELRDLLRRYSGTTEAKQAEAVLSAIAAQRAKAKTEADRVAGLGLRALVPTRNARGETTTLQLENIARSHRWNHDRYDDSWRYREASRGNEFIVADVTISSDEHDPDLPPIGIYRVEEGHLVLDGIATYEFYRWGDYGDYLGNTHDFNNDFDHRRSVRFSAGYKIDSSVFASRPVFVLVGKQGCFSRQTDMFATPKVQYIGATCSMPGTLSAAEASTGFTTLHVFNSSRLQ